MSLLDERQIRVILLDIEGTTTPIDFVYQTLFPYASRKMKSFLHEHAQDAEIRSLIDDFHTQHASDQAHGLNPPTWRNDSDERLLHSSTDYAQWLIAKDSKCTPLKSLEGKIWHEGFANGELHGEVYPDVPRAFERWHRQKREICIYSSGSVLAQQNLFRTVTSGDLTPHIVAFFDTHTGAKADGASYTKIADARGRNASELLFISDAAKEIEAAQSAGMQAILCARDPRSAASPVAGAIIHNLDEVFPDIQ